MAATSEEAEQLRQRVAELEKELERERMRLAACSAAALGYFEGCCDEYKSASLDDVLRLRESIEKLTAERDFQRNEHQTWKVAHAKKCEQITTLKSALRVAKEAIDFYLVANDPSEFGCARDPSVGHLCGTCRADKQQYPLRKAIATINAALGEEK